MSNLKIRVAAQTGHLPKRIASDSAWSAIRTGFSSEVYAQATETNAKTEYVSGFMSMGFTEEQALAMYEGA